MLDDYLLRKDVKDFINELKNNSIFHSVQAHKETKYDKYINSELALYSFYDALLKYKIIIDDDSMINDFIDQIQKLFRKLNQYDDLVIGTNKLICNFVCRHLGIYDTKSNESKTRIITFIYDRYIKDGYYFHGFSTVYDNNIRDKGFIVDNYPNYYSSLIKVNDIFKKYGVSNIMKKDFNNKNIYLTDDFIMGCHYSVTSPNYFYNLLFNEDVYGKRTKKNSYLVGDYFSSISSLKKYMSNNLFSEKDRTEVLNVVHDVWNYLYRVPKKISVIAVKRRVVDGDVKSKVSDFLNINESLYETVDRLLNPKYGNILFDKMILPSNINIISLDSFYDEKDNKKNLEIKVKSEDNKNNNKKSISMEFLNNYGNASFLILLGSMLITLGVIITIVTILRGL